MRLKTGSSWCCGAAPAPPEADGTTSCLCLHVALVSFCPHPEHAVAGTLCVVACAGGLGGDEGGRGACLQNAFLGSGCVL